MTRKPPPDPRGPDELKAGRKLEDAWAARAAAAIRAARAKRAAPFWAAVERRPAPPAEVNNNGRGRPILRLTSRRAGRA